jgi:hypothetical protein
MPVQVLIDERDTINAVVSIAEVTIEIIAGVVRQGDTITLDGLHVEKLSGRNLGPQEVRRLCEELCRHFQVGQLTVRGARRTTGRSAGRIPRVIVFRLPNQ